MPHIIRTKVGWRYWQVVFGRGIETCKTTHPAQLDQNQPERQCCTSIKQTGKDRSDSLGRRPTTSPAQKHSLALKLQLPLPAFRRSRPSGFRYRYLALRRKPRLQRPPADHQTSGHNVYARPQYFLSPEHEEPANPIHSLRQKAITIREKGRISS